MNLDTTKWFNLLFIDYPLLLGISQRFTGCFIWLNFYSARSSVPWWPDMKSSTVDYSNQRYNNIPDFDSQGPLGGDLVAAAVLTTSLNTNCSRQHDVWYRHTLLDMVMASPRGKAVGMRVENDT